MQITLANKRDTEGILALQTQIYRIKSLPKNARKVLNTLIDSDYCDVVVAKVKEKVIGCAFVFYLPIPAHGAFCAFLEGMVVDENFRRQGIGTKLTEKVILLARQKKCYKTLFTSGFDRREIHQFYEKLGFKKWGWEFRKDLP